MGIHAADSALVDGVRAGWPILDEDLIFVGDHKREAAPSVAIFDGWEFMPPTPRFHSYTYDAENRMVQVDGGSTATYTYDGGLAHPWWGFDFCRGS